MVKLKNRVVFFRFFCRFAIALIIIFSAALYSFISWQKHVHFQTFGWDTSVFDQQVYLASKFKTPFSSLMNMNGLGDHFHPLVLLFAGLLYRIWSDPRMLFILQSVIVSLSAWPLYLLTNYLLAKTNLSRNARVMVSMSLCIMYLFSVPFQAMTLDEFHDDPLVTLPLIFMVYFLVTKRGVAYWIAFIFVLLIKEEYGLLGIPLGLFIFLTTKETKRALITAILGVVVFYSLIFHVMPVLAGSTDFIHFRAENKPGYLLKKFIDNPSLLITNFVDRPQKQKTILSTLFSYGFLPIFSPASLILPLSSLAIRFYDETTVRRFEFNNHYASPFLPFIAVSASFGLYKLAHYLIVQRKQKPNIVWSIITSFILFVTVSQNIIFHGPINSIFKKSFYKTQPWENDANELIKNVPQNSVITTQNSLLPHLSQRDIFFLLPELGNAEFIVVDLHGGPNKFSPITLIEMRQFIYDLVENGSYKIIWQKNQALLLKKA